MSKLTDERTSEISEIVARIAFIWLKNPQLRLCQLIGNCFPAGDNYGRLDKELLERLKRVYPMSKEEEKEIEKSVKGMVEEE